MSSRMCLVGIPVWLRMVGLVVDSVQACLVGALDSVRVLLQPSWLCKYLEQYEW